jgi:3-dehydroquinate synthase II
VHSQEEIDLALGILEQGVTGVIIHAGSPAELRAMLTQVKAAVESVALEVATIQTIRPTGMGDRVCIDTCSLMNEAEGMLVGNSSSFLFHVQAEVLPNPYVAPRPFRVNAGPVHSYLRVPEGRTRYLSELQSGDPVMLVHATGAAKPAVVGRCKIERRPLLLIEASCGGATGSILLQNAETIRLTGPEGEARSVVELRPGDPILVARESAGRHFGMKIDETIREH